MRQHAQSMGHQEGFNERLREAAIHLAVIAMVLAVCVALIQPFRGVLLGDDAIYARSVQRLCEQHVLKLSPGTSAALVFQVVWAWLLLLPFGFSISGTVATVLPLAFIGLVALYAIFLDFGQSRTIALLGTVAFLTSPLYLRLLASFMTDVPFVSVCLVAVCFYVHGLRTGARGWYVAGSVAASCALLIRQIGAGIVAAAVVAVIWEAWHSKRRPWVDILATTLCPALACAAYLTWLYRFGGQTWAQASIVTTGTARHLSQPKFVLELAHDLIQYGVLLVFIGIPFLALRWRRLYGHLTTAVRHPVQMIALITAGWVVARLVIGPNGPFYYLGGVLYWMGLGLAAGHWTWVLAPVSIALCAVVRGELECLWRGRSPASGKVAFLFVGVVAGLFLLSACLLPTEFHNDRYLLPILPLAGLLWLAGGPAYRPAYRVAVVLFLMYAAWGVGATRLLYGIAEVQWHEAERLVASGVPREQIRGNWAWEAWWFWDPCLQKAVASGQGAEVTLDCWGTALDTPYKIKVTQTFGLKVPRADNGYDVVAVCPVRTFSLPSEVSVMRRRNSAELLRPVY